MSSDHTIRCDHTISKKWTFDHNENDLFTPSKFVHTVKMFVHTVKILFTLQNGVVHPYQIFIHTM
jgi:L-aminopeptidase/D-esterase-like protein